MPLSYRAFIGYAIFVISCGYFVVHTVLNEIKPGVRQSTEETLVDTANLLAELLADPIKDNNLQNSKWNEWLKRYGERTLAASIWGMEKTSANHRIYVTDRFGKVLLDSKGIAVGQDYSQWRDVYLTLRGRYGARSTKEDPNDESSTVMHVAAPIKHNNNKIIGVVTVAKPNYTLQPYIQRAQWRLGLTAIIFMAAALVIGAALAWWFGLKLQRLTRYASEARLGDKKQLSAETFPSGELRDLAQALDAMRNELDGKAYIERYVQTLTHELKSPIAGIRAAAEILLNPLPVERQTQFARNIESDCIRLQQFIDRMLKLAQLEQQSTLASRENILLKDLVDNLVEPLQERALRRGLNLSNKISPTVVIQGDAFLIKQALNNLIENALDFCSESSTIEIDFDATTTILSVRNKGPHIPEYALKRLTERFYSLPRPATGKKSTGLGLNFVQEVAALHGGRLSITNSSEGVMAALQLEACSPALHIKPT